MVGKEQTALPVVRDFFTRLHGRAETHASVKNLYGHFLVRKNFWCGTRWHDYARFSHSRARWPATGAAADIGADTFTRTIPTCSRRSPSTSDTASSSSRTADRGWRWGYATSRSTTAKHAATTNTTSWRTSCPFARFTYAGFDPWLSGTTARSSTALTTTSRCTSPGTRQSVDSLVCCSRNTSMDAAGCSESRSATSALTTASSAYHCAAVDATFMVATCLSRTNSSGRGKKERKQKQNKTKQKKIRRV